MRSNDFIISRIGEILKSFDTKNIVYGIDEFDDTHIILLSDDVLENVEFQKMEEEIIFDFIDKYPDEGLFFTSEKRDIEDTKIIYLSTILRLDEQVQKLKGIYNKVISDASILRSKLENKTYLLTPKGIITSQEIEEYKPTIDKKGYEINYAKGSQAVICEEPLAEYLKI